MDRKIDRFLNELRGYVARKDRGALADLRRGFSKATAHRAWPYLARWCDLMDNGERAIWLTIAAGFATLEETGKAGNMGATLRGIAIGDRKKKAEALKSFDGRFRRFLTCRSAEEVCERLPGVLRTAKQKSVGVDFRQLWEDLDNWGEDAKVRWAKGYWSVTEEEDAVL
jgi:CRISPR type I-E-associated protein CasB/Cse2